MFVCLFMIGFELHMPWPFWVVFGISWFYHIYNTLDACDDERRKR